MARLHVCTRIPCCLVHDRADRDCICAHSLSVACSCLSSSVQMTSSGTERRSWRSTCKDRHIDKLRHNSQKFSYDMSVFMWSLYTCFRLIPSCLNRINRFALSRIRCLGILAWWLAEIKTVDVWVSTHREIFSHSILLIACYIIEDEDWV